MRGKLAQTTINPHTLRKFDAIAKACGHGRASYLRHLVELHVRALSPKLAKTLDQTHRLDAVEPLREGKKS